MYKPLNVHEYQEEARKTLSPLAWGYYISGARDEITLRENEEAYKRIFIVPRFLRDVSRVDCSTTIFGEAVSSPILIAATAMQKLAHPGMLLKANESVLPEFIKGQSLLLCFPDFL